MDAGADRNPRSAGVGVTRRDEKGAGGTHSLGRVAVAGEQRKEERHHLVADELVDATVMVEDDLGGDGIETVEDRVELRRRKPLSKGRGSTDVGEQHGELDLGAAMVTRQEREAGIAHVRTLVRLALSDHAHHRRADACEGCRAHLAARLAWDSLEDPPAGSLRRMPVGEEVAPELLVDTTRGWVGGHEYPCRTGRQTQ